MPTPTDQQYRVLRCIDYYYREHGYGPTVREIGSIIGLRSPATVHLHLSQLQRKGYISWRPDKNRTLKLTEAGEQAALTR